MEYSKKLNIPTEFIPSDNQLIPFKINLELFGSAGVHGYPEILIKLNNDILYHDTIIEFNELLFDISPTDVSQHLTIEFLNKYEDDTLLENGEVVKDKFLQIKSLKLDDVELLPYKYFKYYPRYTKGFLETGNPAEKILRTNFLSFNGVVIIDFEIPVLSFLAKTYYKDSEFSKFKNQPTIESFQKLANLYVNISHLDF
jgi:hypothetical protein